MLAQMRQMLVGEGLEVLLATAAGKCLEHADGRFVRFDLHLVVELVEFCALGLLQLVELFLMA